MKIKIFLLLVSLNGCDYKVYMTQPSQVSDILEFFNYQKELVIIQHNGKIHNDLNKNSQYVKQKDKVEIITIVGGG
uniref:Thiamine biosynthesis protein n=1 Tax=Undaria pinnatifida TaxID=74381 RepID=A0A0R6LV33_UNDPI|nr:hypothetical protein LEIZ152 [Undaria pinnatifida]YP_011002557.1 hypothetical protein V2388_pgp006 [Undaria peterseniana]AKG50039.1 hypothetical protein LEIZ152 [Undaria pinnatifida]UXC96950.1 hypothetical protein ycf40 [Undaria pinnatifida]UXC97088.1 hypothetical protein ycf40 [Undaria pinnatifida]UXC97226.1 hypothetical protein ycf40 [Undaria pinnatifida]WAL33348.1 hypothetical protein [Undaria peterseniana]